MQSAITSLHLINFRNHLDLKIESSAQLVVIHGKNGVGKTSVLESISLFSPGRGMRGAKANEILRSVNDSDNRHSEWAANATCSNFGDIIHINTGCNLAKSAKRVIKIDDKIINKQSELLEQIRVVWLIPQMERIIFDSASVRRRFWDRICYNLFPEHASNFIAYEYYLKSRMKILWMSNVDTVWLDNIECEIAKYIVQITETRSKSLEIFSALLEKINFIQGINPKLELMPAAFQGAGNSAKISEAQGVCSSYMTELEFEMQLKPNLKGGGLESLDIYEYTLQKLKAFREIDKRSNRSNFGPHKTDLIVTNMERKLNMKHCSTGEQKLMLLAITLAHAQSIYKTCGKSPIILLDEILAHLDGEKQEIVLSELIHINSQIFVTTTERESIIQPKCTSASIISLF